MHTFYEDEDVQLILGNSAIVLIVFVPIPRLASALWVKVARGTPIKV